MTDNRKILIVAFPGLGHIHPALRFASLLTKMGVHITFATSISVVRGLDKKTTAAAGITFAPFSDGHDKTYDKHTATTLQQFVSDFATNGANAVGKIISSATAAGQPFHHLVYTSVLPWAAQMAGNHGIKSTLLWCQSATTLDIYYYYFNEYQGLISANNDNPDFPISLPGLPQLTMADLPSLFWSSSPKEYEFFLPIVKNHFDVLKIAPKILVNTFNELEFESIRATEKLELIPIGPLIPSEFMDGKEYSSDNHSHHDMKEEPKESYMEWLNRKPKSSVVYVSFGSITTLSLDQAEEMAIGLVEGQWPFLWVIRDSEQAGILSKIEGLNDLGMIVDWCSQMEVLSHHAIGCFLTHCGWNSTVEAVAAGVPMVVFPQWTDQSLNGKMVEDVWKTGVRVRRERDGMVEGKEIKRCVEMVMGNEEMKMNADKWRDLAREALNNGGSSTINLQSFLHEA